MTAQAGGTPPPRLAIVIVNWNSGCLLARCIRSISEALTDGVGAAEVVIVDNDSSDGSASIALPDQMSIPMRLIQNAENLGFAAANNIGARATEAPILLFLNPDTELNSGSLAGPLRFLAKDHDGRVGLLGIRLLSPKGDVHRSCAYFPTPARMLGHGMGLDRLLPWLLRPHFMLEWDHNETRVVDQVMGAFLLMRRSDFVALGGFDERFFLYMEDVDLALRAKRLGMDSIFLHTASAIHIGGGTTRSQKESRLIYALRSRILYARKHFGLVGRAVTVITMLLIEPAARLLHALLFGQPGESRAVLKATAWLWRHYPFLELRSSGATKL